jgi:hypothetical protein
MDALLRPVTTRIGDIAARHVNNAMLGRMGHGTRQMTPVNTGIIDYHGPSENTVHVNSNSGGGGGGGFFKTLGKVAGTVGNVIGGVEKAVASAVNIGKAVAPYIPVAAALA